MFKVDDLTKKSLKLANTSVLNDDTFKNVIQNCFKILTNTHESHNFNHINNSKPDVINEISASFLTLIVQFARHNLDQNDVSEFLKNECQLSISRTNFVSDLYEENKNKLLITLGNIGSHYPHITDVKWTIEHKIESINLERTEGPIFRVSLITEVFDENLKQAVQKPVNFTCNTQELQDLIYKLKDAVNHCEKISKRSEVSET